MIERHLRADERRLVLEALTKSGIAPEAICREAVDSSVLIPFRPTAPPILRGLRPFIAYFALRSRASGITLGRRIYIRHQLFDRNGKLPLFLIAHEVAHVVQFIDKGAPSFLSRYIAEYFLGRLRGMADRDAYLAISYEVQARRVEEFLTAADHKKRPDAHS